MYTLFLKRFTVNTAVLTANGVARSFQIEVSVSTKSLDDKGYVVHSGKLKDHLKKEFARKGTETRPLKASGEEICSGAIHLIRQLVGSSLVSAQVRIFSKLGHITLDWNKGGKPQNFPRRALKSEVDKAIRTIRRLRLDNRRDLVVC